MRIPHTICINTKIAYEIHPESSLKNNRKLKSEDFLLWDKYSPKYLTELCVEAIAGVWKDQDFPVELPWCSDTCLLLDILPTNIPLELSVAKIEDDIFWKRCYKGRWPALPPRGKKFSDVPVYTQMMRKKYFQESELPSRRESAFDDMVKRESVVSKVSFKSSRTSIRTLSVDVSANLGDRSWKQCYLEKHLEEYLENLEPENYDAHKIKELSEICGRYVKRLILKQLRAPGTDTGPSDYIPLNPIMSGLPNLKELSVCFKQTYVGERFCWHMLKTTQNDIKSFAMGLEKCRLTVLRVLNSDIDCKKAMMWTKALMKNETLKILDFSHCKIGDFGILAIGRLIQVHPCLETLILKNNNVGPRGAEVLAYLLADSNCKLISLDLRLNEIGPEGGNFFTSMLIQKAQTLKRLYLAGCGMNKKNIEWGRVLAFNKHLEEIDISNNRMGDDVGKEIAKGIKYNHLIINLDVRMSNISPEVEQIIRDKIFKNRMGVKLKHSQWTQLQLQKAVDFIELTEEVQITRDVNKEIAQIFLEPPTKEEDQE